MSKYIEWLCWTSFFVLWWLMLLGVLEPNFVTLPSLLLFGFIGSLASAANRESTKPPSGGNGRHARRKEGR